MDYYIAAASNFSYNCTLFSKLKSKNLITDSVIIIKNNLSVNKKILYYIKKIKLNTI